MLNNLILQIKKFFAKSEIQLAIFAVVLSPFSIWAGLYLNERWAKPMLSVEYVVRTQNDDIDVQRVTFTAAKFGKLELYETFARKSRIRGGFLDFRNLEAHLQQMDLSKFLELAHRTSVEYLAYIRQLENSNDELTGKLDKLDDFQLNVVAHKKLDHFVGLSDKEIVNLIRQTLVQEAVEVRGSKKLLGELEKILSSGTPSTLFQISIQNRGSTDGLIRNLGRIGYKQNFIDIIRVPPPKSNGGTLVAVPTFEMNGAALNANMSKKAVGQIAGNSMANFWFKSMGAFSNGDALCSVGGEVSIMLFDQSKDLIIFKLNCDV